MRSFLRVGLACGLALGGCKPRESDAPGAIAWSGKRRDRNTVVVPVVRAEADQGDEADVLELLQAELRRNLEQLQSEDQELPAYFLGYELYATEELWMEAEDGVLVRNDLDRQRSIDVDVRVGTPTLDNSHSRDGDYGPGNGLGSGLPVSLSDAPLSIAQGLWLDTETQYNNAIASLREVESSEQLRSDDDRQHPDFSREDAIVHVEPEYELDFQAVRNDYKTRLREISQILGDDDAILNSEVVLYAVEENRYLVNSEGSRVQTGSTRLRLLMHARTQAEDGMRLQRSAAFEAHTPAQLPSAEVLRATAEKLRGELLALRQAPIAEPYTGPAILDGRAAGVFFHEIFGHRLEGHRQKDDVEGQTFSDKIGKTILPRFLDVIDDPTVSMLSGIPLSGHYFIDDEAVRARKVVLVEKGKLKSFLLGRSPVLPFLQSNGHGRREAGHQVVARQGNLIVSSRRAFSRRDLRKELIDEVQRQGKPYGLRFEDIDGGYTTTDRSGPQAFKVQPLMVYRVYPDERPDELVRGVEIVGTPLSAFETILATGDAPGVFNGMCGAESGWVPVSAVSPALLLRSIEIERGVHNRERPPLLPPPPRATRTETPTAGPLGRSRARSSSRAATPLAGGPR